MSAELRTILLDHSSEILLLVDPSSLVILEMSKATLQILGYRRDELLGRPITDIECALSDVFFWDEVRQGGLGEAQSVESSYQCANGDTVTTIKTVSRADVEGHARLVICAKPLGPQSQTENELAFLTSRLSATLEATADGILLLDRRGYIINMNQRFARLWCLPDGLLIRRDDHAIFEFMAQAMAQPESYRTTLEAIRPDGDNDTFDVLHLVNGCIMERHSSPARHGELIFGRVFSFTDVTELKKAEIELRIAATAFDSQESMMITDADQVILKVNQAFSRITGYSSEDVIGRTPQFLRSDRHDAGFYENIWENVARDNYWQGEIWNRRKNGEVYPAWLIVTAVKSSGGQTSHYVSGLLDITERKAAEEQLLKLSLAVEQSPESIIITNIDAEIEYVNAAFVKRTGYRREEVIGKNPRLLKSSQTPEKTYVSLWSALEQGQSWKGMFHNRRKDGSDYFEFAIITPIRQQDGRITHYVGVQEDVTEKKRMGEELDRHRNNLKELVLSRTLELAEARDAAESANRAKSEFLSSMSHELRTPLNAILGFSQMLLMALNVSVDQKDDIRTIERAGRTLLSLIDDVLHLARIEAGKLEFALESVTIHKAISSCLTYVRQNAEATNIKLVDAGGDGQNLVIRADPLRLQQVILNLLTNALKYNRPQGFVRISQTVRETMVRIAVTDTGPGIPVSKQARVFNAFDRLGKEVENIEGTGIGLVITKRLVEAMGGRIGFESAEGQGSTFWVEFPISAVAEAKAVAPAKPDGFDNNLAVDADVDHRAILYIEDSLPNQDLMKRLFSQRKNWELRLAPSAEEGILIAQAESPSLILMDIGLPGMDGYEARLVLQSDSRTASIPVVALTAHALIGDHIPKEAEGFAAYITKPFDVSMLLNTMDELIVKKKRA